jgi:putative nucleotidyltransferase with HDIG domain
MASELRLDPALMKRCTVLHDIGKALTHEVEGSHALIGAEIARRYGEPEDVVHAIEAHHNEVEVRTVEAVLTQAADSISGGRPGARRESLELYVKRLERLEQIAASREGVEKVFAMQAGREIRVMVKPDNVDDIQAQVIARDIAKQVEEELTYPGQIRITVVRESRATEFARLFLITGRGTRLPGRSCVPLSPLEPGWSHRMRIRTSACVAAAAATVTLVLSSGSASADGAPPVTHIFSAGAQSAAASYWTPSRQAAATGIAVAQSDPVNPPPGIPSPVYFNGIKTVGALFFTTGTQNHFCTASVVDSGRLDLVLTAAHCVTSGNGTFAQNVVYIPEWHAGVSPFGVWPVENITVTSAWEQSRNINDDFAFLRVGPPAGTSRPIQRVTGGLTLGINEGYHHGKVNVIGYNNTDNAPIICTTASFYALPDQEEFYCNNYNDGTSGGPWILDLNPVTGAGVVFGDIGGYEEGGNFPWASYSSYYSQSIGLLYLHAQGSAL